MGPKMDTFLPSARAPHYLVVEVDPEDGEALIYSVECGGVTDACRRYEDCIPDAAERSLLGEAAEEKPVAHGKRHIMVDGAWCAETTACNVADHDGLGDDVAGRFPVGRHLIDWDFGDGTELFIVGCPASGDDGGADAVHTLGEGHTCGVPGVERPATAGPGGGG
jgi:hypothetical protein